LALPIWSSGPNFDAHFQSSAMALAAIAQASPPAAQSARTRFSRLMLLLLPMIMKWCASGAAGAAPSGGEIDAVHLPLASPVV